MKALSVKQPYAGLIVEGIKDIENRTWKTNYRGTILIHSCKTGYDGFWSNILSSNQMAYLNSINYVPQTLARSAIIGQVDIIYCVKNNQSTWAQKNCWNWVLDFPIKYKEPILNIKGSLGLWNYKNE